MYLLARFRPLRVVRLFALLSVMAVGCSIGSGNLQSRQSSDLQARRVRRIAVVPASVVSSQTSRVPPATTAGSKAAERDASEVLARIVYAEMAAMPHWQIISDSEVREVAQSLPPASETLRLRQIGQMVYADAVITGRMQRFRERVGDEWGAKSPASIAFVLELVDVRRADVIWTARFDETQKALSENIFALGELSQRGVRWLNAEQLTREGVKKAIGQLHQIIARPPPGS